MTNTEQFTLMFIKTAYFDQAKRDEFERLSDAFFAAPNRDKTQLDYLTNLAYTMDDEEEKALMAKYPPQKTKGFLGFGKKYISRDVNDEEHDYFDNAKSRHYTIAGLNRKYELGDKLSREDLRDYADEANPEDMKMIDRFYSDATDAEMMEAINYFENKTGKKLHPDFLYD